MAHRLILIDPLQSSLDELAQQTSSAGHIIVEKCLSYETAVETVSTYRPGVVLITIMPEVTPALQVLHALRNLFPRLPIVVISNMKPDTAIIRFCKEMNISDFLMRPFSYDRLITALSSIKESEEMHQRGIVVCAGFTPTSSVKMMISQLQLAYLYYPTCHLAIQCFRQNRNNRLITLIVQKELEMYSNMLRQKEKTKEEKDLPPWRRVVLEAQLAYQDYWRESIQAGYLPQLLPCLYLPRNAKFPWVLPQEEYEHLNIELIPSQKDFRQITPSKTGVEGTESIYPEMVKEVSNQLDIVEREQPHLIYGKEESISSKEFAISKRIEKPVDIVPTSLRDKPSRMVFDDEE